MSHYGVIAAMPSEARCFSPIKSFRTGPIQVNETFTLIVSGMGRDRAYEASNQLIENGATHLISWGTAAALSNTLKPGDVLLPGKIIDKDLYQHDLMPLSVFNQQDKLQAFYQKGLSISRQNLVETTAFLSGLESKNLLHQSSGGVAADMESAGIRKAASEHELPMSAIRAISDSVHHLVPSWLETSVDEFGQVKSPDFLINLLRSPQDVFSLCKLGFGFSRACQSLKILGKLLKTG